MASRVEEAPHIVRLSAQAEGFTEETNLTVSLHRRKRLHLSHPLPSRRRHGFVPEHLRGQREMAAP